MHGKTFDGAWSGSLAYAIGLIATDGNLSSDGRHIIFTSKDEELINLFKVCLSLHNKTGRKARGGSKDKKYFQVQFGNKGFYNFLLGIGIFPRKSKTISALTIPTSFFADFLRGCIDGDGCIDTYAHPESHHSQLRIRLASASLDFLQWISQIIAQELVIKGGSIDMGTRAYYLQYGKADSIKIMGYIYYPGVSCYLKRKYSIAEPFLADVAEWYTRAA